MTSAGVPERKRCGKCREVKPASQFHRSKKHGLQSYCKPCNIGQNAHFHERLRDQRAALDRASVALKAGDGLVAAAARVSRAMNSFERQCQSLAAVLRDTHEAASRVLEEINSVSQGEKRACRK